MRYVKVDWDLELRGFRTDARDYLAVLPELKDALPSGAMAFASDAGHYDYASERCVKDLELAEISLPTTTAGRSGTASLDFRPNQWKHSAGLRIEYADVSHFSVDYESSIDWTAAITVLLDEVLPHEGGIVHEIELTDATITVHCADLTATWAEIQGT
ncbi:hypothetical protein GCM10009837_55510 [Streptomyces durmitorensis]|uniref:Uncharacterized protein n=1 Tax=Streptomyces durmitorensis TaxID=319947 RepID=A0ABY4PSM6_9ACTN|nr:hypothetical protein [Streptomyces durmitorensis]UQT56209.1 hypothetical protein M4V62_14535 [Streptomyces durmitorensis]